MTNAKWINLSPVATSDDGHSVALQKDAAPGPRVFRVIFGTADSHEEEMYDTVREAQTAFRAMCARLGAA